MKAILAIAAVLFISAGASAQRFHGSGGGFSHGYSSPRIVVVPRVSYGLGFGYGYGGYPYYGYSPYGSPYGYGNLYGYRTSSKLALQIESIKLDYKKQIQDARHDKSITRSERRADIRSLKNERDQAIITEQQNFSNRRTNNGNRAPSYNNNSGTQNNDLLQ